MTLTITPPGGGVEAEIPDEGFALAFASVLELEGEPEVADRIRRVLRFETVDGRLHVVVHDEERHGVGRAALALAGRDDAPGRWTVLTRLAG